MMLRVGLLVDSVLSSKYVYELADWAQGIDGLEISHLIIHHRGLAKSRAKSLSGDMPLFARLAWKLVIVVETLLLRLRGLHQDHYRLYDLSRVIGRLLTINSTPGPLGVWCLAEVEIQKVRATELDLIINFGSGIFGGEILKAARLGIISLYLGGNDARPGSPAGFWECYHRLPRTGLAIQQLTEKLDQMCVVFHGAISTRFWYSRNQAELFTKAHLYLKDVILKIASSGQVPLLERDEPYIYDQAPPASPALGQIVLYSLKLVCRIVWKLLCRLFGLEMRWSIALLEGSFDRAVLWRSREIQSPKGVYWADPMLWCRDGKTYCFVEEYVYKHARGQISVLELCGQTAIRRGTVISEPFHLSFPFVFEHNAELFMCPESSNARQIRVYACQDFPLKWELRAIIMDDVSAADSMIFRYGEKWWMLTNVDRTLTGDYCFELNLYSSDSPLSKHWTPHVNNPIKVNSFGARNAGMAIQNGKLYRFGQRQGFDLYGEGLMIYEITTLTESDYRERLVQEIMPHFRRGIAGIHHMSCNGEFTVFDQGGLFRWNRGGDAKIGKSQIRRFPRRV